MVTKRTNAQVGNMLQKYAASDFFRLYCLFVNLGLDRQYIFLNERAHTGCEWSLSTCPPSGVPHSTPCRLFLVANNFRSLVIW